MINHGSNLQPRGRAEARAAFEDHLQIGVNALVVGLLLAEFAVAGLILLTVCYLCGRP